jgi:hypothetical protein
MSVNLFMVNFPTHYLLFVAYKWLSLRLYTCKNSVPIAMISTALKTRFISILYITNAIMVRNGICAFYELSGDRGGTVVKVLCYKP